MNNIYSTLLSRLQTENTSDSEIITWASPIPVFGDLSKSRVATLGLNPSNREFVDAYGNELEGKDRRFHTLKSLGVKNWSNLTLEQLSLIAESCENYFYKNPYDVWFGALEKLIIGTGCSYYNTLFGKACHLDIVPYATSVKWASLSSRQKKILIDLSSDILIELLRIGPIRLLILNGSTVVKSFKEMFQLELEEKVVPDWTLPRSSGKGVTGYSYYGKIDHLAGVDLTHEIVVIGFNHNIQSSFGVTNSVKLSIQQWITEVSKGIDL